MATPFDPERELEELLGAAPPPAAGAAPFDPESELRNLQMRRPPSMPSPFTTESGPFGVPGIPRPLQIAGSALARGATLAAGAPGDLFDYIDRYAAERIIPRLKDARQSVLNSVRRAAGQPEQLMPALPNQEDAAASGPILNPVEPPTLVPGSGPRMFARPLGLPSSGELQEPLTSAGIVNNPRLAPQTSGEHFIDRAAEVAGASIPFGARGIFSGATSGLADEAARQFGAGPWARLGAAFAGGISGNLVYGVGERLVNSVLGRLTPTGQAYREAGVTPRMVGDVTGSPAAQRIQSMAATMPGGAGRAADAADDTLREFTSAIDRAASQYGTARTAEQAGEALQAGARQWVQNWRATSADAWDDVLRILPADATMPVDNLRRVINGVGQRMRDVPEVASALSSDRFSALRTAINQSPEQWRSESVRTMRTIIGQLNEAKGLVGDIFTGELDQIYRALSQDIRQAVAMQPGGMRAWTRANAITSQGHQIHDRIVNPLIREGATPSNAYQFATSQISARTGGGSRIGEVADVTGAGGEVAAARISEMGGRVLESRTPSTFSQLTNPASARGMAPEAAARLFGAPGSRDRRLMEALDVVARSARATERYANTSRTAPTSLMQQYFGTTVPAAAMAAGGAVSGHVPWSMAGPAIGAAVGVPLAGYVGSRLMSNPLLARYLTAQTTAPGASQVTMNQLLQLMLARQPLPALPAR